MSKIDKRKYCIIAVDNTKGIKDEVLSISVDPYKYIEGTNMILMTFTTFMSPLEMEDIFEGKDRTYFIFELNTDTAIVRLNDTNFHKYLFGDMSNKSQGKIDIVETMFGIMGVNNHTEDIDKKELFNRINKNENKIGEILSNLQKNAKKVYDKFSIDELNEYTKEQRDDLVDELLDKGSKLTEKDKEVLNFLIKKRN